MRISNVEADGAMMLCKETFEFLIGIRILLFLISHVHDSGNAITSPCLPKQISKRSSLGVFRWFWALLGRQLLISYLICPSRSHGYLPFLIALAPHTSSISAITCSISAIACSPAYNLSSPTLHEIHQARRLHYLINPGHTPCDHAIEIGQILLLLLRSSQLLEAAHALMV